MADEKISALPSAGALAGTEPLPIVQGGVTKKITVQDVANLKATPDLQQVTTAGSTTSVGITVDNGAGESIDVKHDRININNALGIATITSPTLTTATNFAIPNKSGGTETFAMLSDITGGGDVYLANDQTFTGENTFAIGSGNDTPVTITKGGSGAGLKVTKSSGSGDAIEVAQGSVSIDDETASTIASFDANKRIKSLATSTYPSLTELSYVKGVTSAIQTQLNAKSPIANCSNGTAVTGITTNAYSKGLSIPANSRTANDAPQVDVKVSKTGVAGTLTIRLYWNTTNDLVGSPILLGTGTALAASTRSTTFQRILSIEVAAGTGNGTLVSSATTAGATDYAAFTAVQTVAAIDWTAAGYLICAVQNGSAGDSSVCNMIKIH
jgi:hypothetical protein